MIEQFRWWVAENYDETGLNPYSNGMMIELVVKSFENKNYAKVLILILMEW